MPFKKGDQVSVIRDISENSTISNVDVHGDFVSLEIQGAAIFKKGQLLSDGSDTYEVTEVTARTDSSTIELYRRGARKQAGEVAGFPESTGPSAGPARTEEAPADLSLTAQELNK